MRAVIAVELVAAGEAPDFEFEKEVEGATEVEGILFRCTRMLAGIVQLASSKEERREKIEGVIQGALRTFPDTW